ncbi:hypothetical protein PG994_001012 [Apiospora phragmitis]|uniref:Ankyrin n=1 Tax=Apiospora phragmitis TaxID=2905665 RepID=A0ABR1WR75_9PEZI
MPHLLRLRTDSFIQPVLEIMPGPLRNQSWWNADRRLMTLLAKFNGSHATQEHDHIYALLGIASDTPDMPIDYGLPFHQVVNRTVALLTLGDAGLGSLICKRYSIPYPDVFQGLSDTNAFTARIVELALVRREDLFLLWLIRSADTTVVAEETIAGWNKDIPDHLHPTHAMEKTDFDQLWQSVAGFQNIMKRIRTTDPSTLPSIIKLIVCQGRGYQWQTLEDFGLGESLNFKTSCYDAVDWGNTETLKHLLERCAPPSTKFGPLVTGLLFRALNVDEERPTFPRVRNKPSHLASLRVVPMLAEQGADLGRRNTNGDTPLHLAEHGYIRDITNGGSIIPGILLLGADDLAENSSGRTPWQVNSLNIPKRKRRNRKEMEDLLSVVPTTDRHLYVGFLEGREDEEKPVTTVP